MSPIERLRELLTPGADRWRPMLVGLALAAACAGAAVLARESPLASLFMTFVALAAWFAGACAMVGYVRWFYAESLRQAERDRDAMKQPGRRPGSPGE